MKINKILIGFSCFYIIACNTPPSKIAPIYQGGDPYEKYDCKRLSRQLSQLSMTISAQASQLQSDANMDKGIVAGSIIFLPLGLFALAATGNGDLKNHYAQNLGKQEAIKNSMEAKDCET